MVGINVVSQALQDGGYGERILCAVFAFRDAQDKPVYWIYNYKRGAYYPFVPAGGAQQRDTERELRLKAQIGNELPVEAGARALVPPLGHPDLSPDPRASRLSPAGRPAGPVAFSRGSARRR